MTLKRGSQESGRPDAFSSSASEPAADSPAAPSAGPSNGDLAQSFFPDWEIVARALEATEIGVWAWDIGTNKVTWSRNLERIHRMPSGSFDGTFAKFEQDIHPDDRPTVIAALKEALETRRPYSVIYRLPPKPDQGDHWLTTSGMIFGAGASAKLFGICRDVTARIQTEHELRMRAQRQEIVARLGARALAEEDLQGLLEEIASTAATILDVDLVNILELVPGGETLLFRAGHGWKTGTIKSAEIQVHSGTQADYTLGAFGPVLIPDLCTETRFTPSDILLDHGVISGMSTTIVGHDRRKYGIFSVHSKQRRDFTDYDVSLLTSIANIIAGAIQRRQLDERQKLMIRELHHQSGNLFSQLLALLSQTAQTSKSVSELVSKYEARVFALANANRLMVEGGWQPTSILSLLRTQLAPCLDRVSLTGPDIYLEPPLAFALSCVTHELLSNAMKYGSLSAAAGRIELKWSLDPAQRAMILDWQELGGPPPKRRARPGFGSRLINTVIKRQMNGQVRRTFPRSGMTCRLAIPLTHQRWPEAAATD